MNTLSDTLPPRGSRLPRATLRTVPGDATAASLLRNPGPLALALLHPGHCEECRRYVRALAAARGAFAEWGARAVAVAPGSPAPLRDLADAAGGDVRVLADPDGRLASGTPAVLVADEWGEVFHAEPAGDDHRFPDPAELADWTRFVAIQCPECEGPEGAWTTL